MSQHMFQELRSGRWAEINPSKCPCRGGWLVSDLDTYHQCPIHGGGVPHPETEDPGDVPFDFEAHRLGCFRAAYRIFRDRANLHPRAFEEACRMKVRNARYETHGFDDRSPITPQEWVNAAEMIADQEMAKAEELKARMQGYSCALEMRWAEEAAREDQERRGYGGFWEA